MFNVSVHHGFLGIYVQSVCVCVCELLGYYAYSCSFMLACSPELIRLQT